MEGPILHPPKLTISPKDIQLYNNDDIHDICKEYFMNKVDQKSFIIKILKMRTRKNITQIQTIAKLYNIEENLSCCSDFRSSNESILFTIKNELGQKGLLRAHPKHYSCARLMYKYDPTKYNKMSSKTAAYLKQIPTVSYNSIRDQYWYMQNVLGNMPDYFAAEEYADGLEKRMKKRREEEEKRRRKEEKKKREEEQKWYMYNFSDIANGAYNACFASDDICYICDQYIVTHIHMHPNEKNKHTICEPCYLTFLRMEYENDYDDDYYDDDGEVIDQNIIECPFCRRPQNL